MQLNTIIINLLNNKTDDGTLSVSDFQSDTTEQMKLLTSDEDFAILTQNAQKDFAILTQNNKKNFAERKKRRNFALRL